MAVILLAYAAARFVRLPDNTLALQLAGIYLPLQINIHTIVAVLVAGLTATGTDWLLRSQEDRASRSINRHLLLPAMTAWVLSLLLSNIPFSSQWWLAFGGSALFLLAILIAEYASASPENRYYAIATQALSALTYGLFLILAITVRGVGLRLYLAFPAMALGAFLAGSRVQLLRPGQSWQPLPVAGITFIVVQIAAALHYLPISALGYGLGLLGTLYALNDYVAAIDTGETFREAARRPAVVLSLFWLLAILLR